MLFFKKNKIDLDLGDQVSISVTDAIASNTGADFVDYLRNRSNDSGWATSDSTDAANTTLDILFGEEHDINALFFLRQNWKQYTCQYALGAGSLTDFSTPINVSANVEADRYHSFNTVSADRLRIVIAGTTVVDDDKVCSQVIATELIGGFSTIQPDVASIEVGRNRRLVKNISGKGRVQRNVGAVSFSLRKNNVTDDADLALIESLYEYRNGFLVWPNANADVLKPEFAARLNARQFWRRRDFYLMNIATELPAGWNNGRFSYGIDLDADLVEVA